MTPAMTKVAGGNISPSRFVKLSTTADGKALQAGAAEAVIGISQKGTRNPPYSTLDDGYAAIAGENVHIFGPTQICGLELGGTVTRGDRLKSHTDGTGLTSAGTEYGAIALQSGTAGDVVEVMVTLGKFA